MSTELALFDHAKEALAAAVRFDEVQSIRSAAEQAKAYARIARDRKMMADAQEIIARAERKLGIMLRQAKGDGLLSQGGRPSAERSNVSEPETGADEEPVFDNTPFTLSDIGVDKKLSSRAQRSAEMADDEFEAAVTAKREQTLSADAAVVSPPKVHRAPAAPKAPVVKSLGEEEWHRFAFSVIALSMASDRVSSEAILLMAESRGIVELDGDTIDFTPEAMKAMGPLGEIALRAIEGDFENTPEGSGTAREASGGQPLPSNGDIGDLQHGTQSAPRPHPSEPLSTEEADVIIRAGYMADPPASVSSLADAIGRPCNKAYVRNRARVMKISDPENQRSAASAFATALNASRKAGDA
ncbi:MAG: hypothetical protein P0Y65_20590 [Candidatus Devosia phytovorans]|uniref:Uncharacterized protein n=1 Tax=Candidatus Devosia phytovorans TaxID=3121372 RepID=A0AAJ5VTJ0_9HYPH|nr:hypothetical protein [Devosia sp.]WEK04541.1 MAG: hypothetical protein P0Y65_20590 [Devosia sp.]